MKVIKTERRTIETDVTIDHYHECDKCKSRIKPDNAYDAFECQVRLRVGTSYPEGEFGSVTTIDLCKKCAEELITFLQYNSYRVNKSEIDD